MDIKDMVRGNLRDLPMALPSHTRQVNAVGPFGHLSCRRRQASVSWQTLDFDLIGVIDMLNQRSSGQYDFLQSRRYIITAAHLKYHKTAHHEGGTVMDAVLPCAARLQFRRCLKFWNLER